MQEVLCLLLQLWSGSCVPCPASIVCLAWKRCLTNCFGPQVVTLHHPGASAASRESSSLTVQQAVWCLAPHCHRAGLGFLAALQQEL